MAPTPQQTKTAKTKVLSGGKQPKARIQRYLQSTQPQLIEGAKSALLLRGIRCSDVMFAVLKDIRAMKAPHAKVLTKNNMITPMDGDVAHQQSLEFLCAKNDCSLIGLASSNRKRPSNLILGRTFDRRVLDWVELGIARYKSLADYSGKGRRRRRPAAGDENGNDNDGDNDADDAGFGGGGDVPKKRVGSKPLLLFVGDRWSLSAEYRRVQNLLIDFYRGEPLDKIVLSGLDHIMVFTIADPTGGAVGDDAKPMIHQRTYYVKLKKNPKGGKVPMPYLTSCGPDMDFKIRRTQFASPEVWKLALKQPKAIKSQKQQKKKNRTTNIFGETIGRLHLEKQNIDKMQGRKAKALRIAGKMEAEREKAATEEELQREKDEMGMEFRRTYGFDDSELSEGGVVKKN